MSFDLDFAKSRGISAPHAVGFMPFEEKDGHIVLKDIDLRQLAQDAAHSLFLPIHTYRRPRQGIPGVSPEDRPPLGV